MIVTQPVDIAWGEKKNQRMGQGVARVLDHFREYSYYVLQHLELALPPFPIRISAHGSEKLRVLVQRLDLLSPIGKSRWSS